MSPCPFCEIAAGRVPAPIVYEDSETLAFVGIRQFHPGHMLVIPRKHFVDVRDLDEQAGAALMATVARITRAVGQAFPNDGISLWHSIGPAAFQEVQHLHIHVHPRRHGDDFLRIYPHEPPMPDFAVREEYASRVRSMLLGAVD